MTAMFGELERRRCAGGPLVVRDDGSLDRLAPDDFIGTALVRLPEHERTRPDEDAGLTAMLDDMNLTSLEALRSFRRWSLSTPRSPR